MGLECGYNSRCIKPKDVVKIALDTAVAAGNHDWVAQNIVFSEVDTMGSCSNIRAGLKQVQGNIVENLVEHLSYRYSKAEWSDSGL